MRRAVTAGFASLLAGLGCNGENDSIGETAARPNHGAHDSGLSTAHDSGQRDGTTTQESGARDGASTDAAAPTAPDTGPPIPPTGCEGYQCYNGRIGFSAGCVRGFSLCDPATSGGAECAPEGPCPTAGDSAPVDPCVGADTNIDPAHCGGCGHACPPSTVAANARFASGIAVNATAVYWTDDNDGSLMSAPLGSGSPATLVAGKTNSAAFALALDATHVYWTSYGAADNIGTVDRMPLGGGTAITLATTHDDYPLGIAVDAASVYFTQSNGALMSIPLSGGTPTTLVAAGVDPYPFKIAVNTTHVYWVGSPFAGSQVAGVVKTPIAGGASTVVAQGSVVAIALAGTNVYWIARGSSAFNSTILTAPLAGGAPTTITTRVVQPFGFAVDDSGVYWTSTGTVWGPNGFDGSILRAPLAGGPSTTLASQQRQPQALALGGTDVYWGNRDADGAVMRIDKEPCQAGVCR